MIPETRKIIPQMAVEILKEHNTIVIEEDAELMLEIQYKFGHLVLQQIFDEKGET